MAFILPLLVGLLLYAIVRAGVRSSGNALGKKFESLGEMRGKTLAEISRVVGDPVATSDMGNGKVLYQWAATGFRVALMFDGQVCSGISSVYGATVS